MTDFYKIDSHKLIYHPDRVSAFLKGENIYPIYVEVSPNRSCNHRCNYCGLDFMKYENKQLNYNIFIKILDEIKKLGIKSIMYAGEGEPLINKWTSHMIIHTKNIGIDVALTTNSVFLKNSLIDIVLANSKWIKISLDAAKPETYSKIRNTKTDDFNVVIENISNAVKHKHRYSYDCTIGIQMVLLPENWGEVISLANMSKNIGVDYFVVKPYSQHIMSKKNKYYKIYTDDDNEYFNHIKNKFDSMSDDNFNAILRINSINEYISEEKEYKECLALSFWSYISTDGSVWGCSCYLGDERFYYGNINYQTFEEIWKSQKREKSLQWVKENLNVSLCRINCRMDEINTYLWKLKNPPKHVNFI